MGEVDLICGFVALILIVFKALGGFYPIVSLLRIRVTGKARILPQILTLHKSCSGKRETPFLCGEPGLMPQLCGFTQSACSY